MHLIRWSMQSSTKFRHTKQALPGSVRSLLRLLGASQQPQQGQHRQNQQQGRRDRHPRQDDRDRDRQQEPEPGRGPDPSRRP